MFERDVLAADDGRNESRAAARESRDGAGDAARAEFRDDAARAEFRDDAAREEFRDDAAREEFRDDAAREGSCDDEHDLPANLKNVNYPQKKCRLYNWKF